MSPPEIYPVWTPELAAMQHEASAFDLESRALRARVEAAVWGSSGPMLDYLVARHTGEAAGHRFRAAELRYDARGGMTKEQARRRFEPGARWAYRAGAQASAPLCSIRWASADASYLCLAPGPSGRDTFLPRRADMTRANGWLFLDLGQGAEPGRCAELTAGYARRHGLAEIKPGWRHEPGMRVVFSAGLGEVPVVPFAAWRCECGFEADKPDCHRIMGDPSATAPYCTLRWTRNADYAPPGGWP